MTLSGTRPAKSAKRLALALLTALAVLGVCALAVSGAGKVKDNPGAGPSAAGSANAGKAFSLSGDLSAQLVLGAAGQPVDLRIENPNAQTLVVSEIGVTVANVSGTAGCTTGQFSVRQTSASVTVPPRGGVTLTGDARPRVAWVNDPARLQDACKGAVLTLAYTGRGTLR